MKEAEHQRWQHYLILAVVLTIFGLMIYQVVMQEQKVDQYYVSVILAPTDNDITGGLPTYPMGASGTLNGGIRRVRDAVASVVAADTSFNMHIPHWSKWKLNVVPVIDPTTHALTGANYHYTFPIRSAVLDDTATILDIILANSQTVTDLFINEATEVKTWATDTFDTEVHAALTYGTYSTGVAGNATE